MKYQYDLSRRHAMREIEREGFCNKRLRGITFGRVLVFLSLLCLLMLSASGAYAAMVCSDCHNSPHGDDCGTSCTSCHSRNLPHEAAAGAPVVCVDCHVSPLHNGTVPTVTNSCGQCHGASGPGMNFTTEQLLAVTVPTAHNASPLTMNCQVCHTEILQEMHPDRNPGTPNDCSTCHVSIHRNTQVDVRVSCGQCHGGDSPAQPNTPYFTVAQLEQFVYNFHNAIPGGGISWSADSSISYKINFTALGCQSGHNCTYAWDFGDGEMTTVSTADISHTYADATIQMAYLVVTDLSNWTHTQPIATQVRPLTRNIAPVPSYTLGINIWTVTLVDTSTDDAAFPPKAVRVEWGDGTFSTGNAGGTFTRVYTRQGSYIVKMSVTDAAGVKRSAGNAQVVVPTKVTISGKVVRLDGITPVSGVSIRLMKGATVVKIASTQTDGTYILTDVIPDIYTVRAVKSGLVFVDQSVDATGGNVTDVNFTADR